MRKFFIIAFTSVLFASCGNNSQVLENDTIQDSQMNVEPYDTIPPKGIVSLIDYENRKGIYIDIDFDGVYELVENPQFSDEYDPYTNAKLSVYSFINGQKLLRKVRPFNDIHFRTASWVLSSGTEIDYSNKTLTLYSMEEGSCSDHGVVLIDTYTFNPFNHTRKRNVYDYGD